MKKWVLPVIIFGCLMGFVIREVVVSQNQYPVILAEENVVLFYAGQGQVFGMGRIDSPKAHALSRSFLPFFTSNGISDIWDISIGKEVGGDGFLIQRVSQNLIRSVCGDRSMWWMGEDFSSEEQEVVVQTGVSFDADWWIMTRNTMLEFLPIPRQGIIFAGDRVPSKKTISFAMEKEIPLLVAKEAGGLSLKILSDAQWELKTRNP